MNPANHLERILSLIGCLLIVAYGMASTKQEWLLTTAFVFFAISLVIGFRDHWLPTEHERKTQPPTGFGREAKTKPEGRKSLPPE